MAMTMAQEKPVQAGLAKRMTAQRKPRGRERPAFQNRPAGGQTPPRPQVRQPQTATAGVRPVQSQYQTPGRPAAPSMGATQPQPQRPVGTLANQQYMGGSQQSGYRGFSPDYYAKMRAQQAAPPQQPQMPYGQYGGTSNQTRPPNPYMGAQQPQTPQQAPTNGYGWAAGTPVTAQMQAQAAPQGMNPVQFGQMAGQMANMNPVQLGQFAQNMGQPQPQPQWNTMQQWNPNQRWR